MQSLHTTWKPGGKGVHIRYALGDSPLGRMLVATRALGICAVALATTDTELETELAERYPHAQRTRDDAGLEDQMRSVLAYLHEPASAPPLPLDIRRTAFQERVWEALQQIPPGKPVSYRDIARQIGSPKGSRAVGGACAANPVALLIPCHRVLAANKSAHHWRWGVERKRQLLEMEAQASAAALR